MAAIIDIQQQAPTSRFKRFTLIWIVSAVLLAGSGASIFLLKVLIERDQRLVAGFIGSSLDQTLTRQDFINRQVANDKRSLNLYKHLKRYRQVERLTLYNLDGNSVWSSQGVTSSIPAKTLASLKKPLGGTIQISYVSSSRLISEKDHKGRGFWLPWLPELLLSVRGNTNSIIGVARVTRVPELLIGDLIFGLLLLWGILILSGGIYYIFFYRLFMRTSSELVACEVDLEKSRRLAELGECVSMIVHDTRNLMGSIQFILERLRDTKITEIRRNELIDGAKKPLQMSFAMMEDMLAFVSGKQPALVCYKHHLKQVIAEGQDMLMAMLETAGHKLKIEIPDDLIIYWDSQKLLHILVNLLRNAAESMTKPGEVTITATRDKGGVHMQVRDTGDGIPDALLPNLFKPFMSEPGKTRPGLGLAIIRDLVRRHGGEVTARNWEHGAEFDLYFPDCPTDDN
jgi:signal transduction histidine kinase